MAAAGRPFTKTGASGLYVRRAELGEALCGTTRNRLVDLAQKLEQTGRIVTALADGTTVKWLDIPDWPFAGGKGQFAAGAGTGQGGRRRAGDPDTVPAFPLPTGTGSPSGTVKPSISMGCYRSRPIPFPKHIGNG